jgi:hypothetical protein
MGDSDDGGRTVACRPRLRGGESAKAILEAHVQTIQRVVMLGTEAIALLVREDCENAQKSSADMLNLGNQSIVHAMLNGVVNGQGATNPETRVAQGRARDAYRRIHGANAPLIPGKGLSAAINSEARSYVALVKTSLKVHFAKRVKRYCKAKLAVDPDTFKKFTKAQKLAHADRVSAVVWDVCRPSWKAPIVTSEADVALVEATRAMLGMDAIEWSPRNAKGKTVDKSLYDVIKQAPHLFFKGMAALADAFAANGERGFRIVPMRSSLTPRFVTLDQEVLKEIGLVTKEAKADLAKRATKRREKTKPYKERLKAITAELAEHKAAWKQADTLRNAALKPKEKKIPPSDKEVERRKAVEAEIKARALAIEENPVYVELCDGAAAEKRETFEAVFDLSKAETEKGKTLSKRDAALWMHGAKTDGVSMRLLLQTKSTPRNPKRARDDGDARRPLPRRGLLTVERLRESLLGSEDAPTLGAAARARAAAMDSKGALHQNDDLNAILDDLVARDAMPTIVGGDPGMHELLRLACPDRLWKSREARDELMHEADTTKRWKDVCGQIRAGYTLKQRREEAAPGRYFLKKRHQDDPERKRRAEAARAYRHTHLYKPEAVVAAERDLSAYNSNGPTASKLFAYLQARAARLPVLTPWYADPQRRLLRWKRFLSEQRSFSQFCDRIRRMMQPRETDVTAPESKKRPKKRPFVIAYGAKGASNGLVVKGIAPCINTGLLKKLSREFLIVTVPEHYTSKRCGHCKGECGNHAYLAERDRRAQSDERLECRCHQKLELADTAAQREKIRAKFDRDLSNPVEIRGLRFCQSCGRCLNRDANSAPQMAVQLKRLLLGLGPLYKRNKTEEKIEAREMELGTL